MSDHIPTLADLCCAIAEGHLPTVLDGDVYQVNALELRRYLNRLRPLPAVPQPSASSTGSDKWSTSSKISVA